PQWGQCFSTTRQRRDIVHDASFFCMTDQDRNKRENCVSWRDATMANWGANVSSLGGWSRARANASATIGGISRAIAVSTRCPESWPNGTLRTAAATWFSSQENK